MGDGQLQRPIEFNDRYSQSTYHQLGIVAQEQREWATAASHYNRAGVGQRTITTGALKGLAGVPGF
ncbi:MAG: hypothetical protein H6660_11325 [Ardenticatenaceae bacterium]|nr:hypothetical protein [Ardenticatenaceae bacterium]